MYDVTSLNICCLLLFSTFRYSLLLSRTRVQSFSSRYYMDIFPQRANLIFVHPLGQLPWVNHNLKFFQNRNSILTYHMFKTTSGGSIHVLYPFIKGYNTKWVTHIFPLQTTYSCAVIPESSTTLDFPPQVPVFPKLMITCPIF